MPLPSSILPELNAILHGEISIDNDLLHEHSTDKSVFQVEPAAVILPKDVSDITALVRWVKARKEHESNNPVFSLTARGQGTDKFGGSLTEGIVVGLSGSLNKTLEARHNFVRVQAGAIIGEVNALLAAHGRFLPFYPSSHARSTVGGAIANNIAGEKALKYGSARLYVKALKMVLASGSEVTVLPMTHADLELKKKQFNFEGDIYRGVDAVLKKYRKLLDATEPSMDKYSNGYNLWDAERVTDEGRVLDLTQLIAGSQGTLGIITEVSLWSLPRPRFSGALMISFDNLARAGEASIRLARLEPSSLEMTDRFLLEIARRQKPELVNGFFPGQLPAAVLWCELDGPYPEFIVERLKIAAKEVEGLAVDVKIASELKEQEGLLRVRRLALDVLSEIPGDKKPLSFIDDVTLPAGKWAEYLEALYVILQKHAVECAVWGSAGDGNLQTKVFLDLADPSDREKIFVITKEAFGLVVKLGGVLSGEQSDGIMRTPYLSRLYPKELLAAWQEVKRIFDPLGIFNPGKKGEIDLSYAKSRLRGSFRND